MNDFSSDVFKNNPKFRYYEKPVYKFIDIKGSKELLKNKTFRFSKPASLNDPFDCNSKLLKIGDKNNYIKSLVDRNFKDLGRKERREKQKNFIKKWDDNYFDKVIQKRINEIGICSFTSDFANSLLWSYYAEKHKGICLKFEIKLGFGSDISISPIMEINYPELFNKIEYNGNNFDALIEWLITKSREWRHEEEVRFIKTTLNTESDFEDIVFPDSFLKKIVFGYRADPKDVKFIMNQVKRDFRTTIEFSQMNIDSRCLKLKESKIVL